MQALREPVSGGTPDRVVRLRPDACFDVVPLENRIQLVIGKCSGPQAACVYSLIRPLRIGFRRI